MSDPKYRISQKLSYLVAGDDYYAVVDDNDHSVAIAETRELAEKIDDILCGKRVDRPNTFCTLGWTPGDLETLFDVTVEEAEEFFDKCGNNIVSSMVLVGWDILAIEGDLHGLKRRAPE